ncbi:MAG: hypothetical protein AXW15_05800 [Neptuniibacter sp. Phe_28]|nr:MAG: hypothetical protein AXW15_05800 [Neptuniibacter sp. Phe_28]
MAGNEWPPQLEPQKGTPAARLKEERVRNDLDVKSLCDKLSVVDRPCITHKSYAWFECGEKDFLPIFKTQHWKRLSEIGFDIQYIISGIPSAIRDQKEAALIDNYRECSAANQQHLEAVSTAFKEQEIEPSRKVDY